MTLIGETRSRIALHIQLFMTYCRVLGEDKEQLPGACRKSLETAEMGAQCLNMVSSPWKERLTPLLHHPHLQLESLVMFQQFDAAEALLAAYPGLHDDDMLLQYARWFQEPKSYIKMSHINITKTHSCTLSTQSRASHLITRCSCIELHPRLGFFKVKLYCYAMNFTGFAGQRYLLPPGRTMPSQLQDHHQAFSLAPPHLGLQQVRAYQGQSHNCVFITTHQLNGKRLAYTQIRPRHWDGSSVGLTHSQEMLSTVCCLPPSSSASAFLLEPYW